MNLLVTGKTVPLGLIMRLTAFFLLAGMLHVSAASFSQKVTITGKNLTLDQIFHSIEQQTGYAFVYQNSYSEKMAPLTMSMRDAPIEQVLAACLKGRNLGFSIKNGVIVIHSIPPAAGTPVSTGIIDEGDTKDPGIEARGYVMSVKGEFLAGANVVIKRTKKGTITDAKGAFRLTGAKLGDTLIISFIGYTSRMIQLTSTQDNLQLYISLDVADNRLDQMVVQAYGTTSQRLTTGNIARVTAAEIEKQPVMNPLMALQGRVAGMVVTPASGYAAGTIKVEIRGRNTISSSFTSDPLYIIDGVPLTILGVAGNDSYESGSAGVTQAGGIIATSGQSPLFNLNPRDIESIEVLKDADATAIYGSRGANGVILITTKKGKVGPSQFSVYVTQGMTGIPRHMKMLNTPQYLQMRREAFRNDGIIPTPANAPDLFLWDTTHNFDWQKETWGHVGKVTNAMAIVSGGNIQTTFRLSANYSKQTSVLTSSGSDQRGGISFNVTDHEMGQKLTISLTTNYNYSYVNTTLTPNSITLPPNAPAIYDKNGNLNYGPWDAAGMTFPFTFLKASYTSGTNLLQTSLALNYEIVKGLVLTGNLGYNNMQNKVENLLPIAAQDPVLNPSGYATFGKTGNTGWLLEPQLSYKTFFGEGKLSILAGASAQSTTTDGTTMTGYGYTSDDLLRSISGAAGTFTNQAYAQYKYAALFGRINFDWGNKYILNLNVRRDGSSRFGDGKQFGNFGSAGAAWIASEEQWLKKALPSYLSFVKLRGSYGITGSDNVGDYQYLSQWSNAPTGTVLPPYGGVPSLANMHAVNQQYHWQTVKKMEAALDLGFLKDRISLEVAWYRDRCNNQLLQYPTASFTGFPQVTANWPADLQNSGWEFQVNAKAVSNNRFTWNAAFNISINRNKLVSYPGIELSPYATRMKVGRSVNTVYLLHSMGVDPLTGQYSFYDYDHNGSISANTGVVPGTAGDDRYVAIDKSPAFTGGLNNEFSYGNCRLSFFLNFMKQRGVNSSIGGIPGLTANTSEKVFNERWRKPGDRATFARFTQISYTPSDLNYSNYSDALYTDASFIQLANAAFTYTLPAAFAKRAGMQNCNLFVNMQNIFTITSYNGIDPQLQSFGGLPTSRTFVGGISIGF